MPFAKQHPMFYMPLQTRVRAKSSVFELMVIGFDRSTPYLFFSLSATSQFDIPLNTKQFRGFIPADFFTTFIIIYATLKFCSQRGLLVNLIISYSNLSLVSWQLAISTPVDDRSPNPLELPAVVANWSSTAITLQFLFRWIRRNLSTFVQMRGKFRFGKSCYSLARRPISRCLWIPLSGDQRVIRPSNPSSLNLFFQLPNRANLMESESLRVAENIQICFCMGVSSD